MASKVVKGAASVTKPTNKDQAALITGGTSNSSRRSDEKIRNLAYQKWVAAGCPPGDGVPFWLEAERECA